LLSLQETRHLVTTKNHR